MTPGQARFTRFVTETWGLRHADFSIAPGDSVALIGPVGSGKTTLLRAIADVLPADESSIEVDGRVATLLSPDGGTLETLTGRENAMLLAVLAGLSREQAAGQMEAVREGCGLGDAFERPVSSYSQGMLARPAARSHVARPYGKSDQRPRGPRRGRGSRVVPASRLR